MNPLITEFLDDRRAAGLSPYTVKGYRQSLTHFAKFVGDIEVTEVSRRTVKAFLADRRERGEASATLYGRHASLSAFYSWLVDEQEVSTNPVKRVPRPKAEVVPTELVTEDQFRALLGLESRTRFLTIRNRALLWTLYDCGIRVGELCGLCVNDVDFEAMSLAVNGKTGRRVVPFGRKCGAALRRYLRLRNKHPRCNENAFFIGNNGPTTTASVLHMCRTYGPQVGMPWLSPHVFRHTWVHALLNSGATLLDVRVLGGWHSVREITERYGVAGRHDRAMQAHRMHSPGDRLG